MTPITKLMRLGAILTGAFFLCETLPSGAAEIVIEADSYMPYTGDSDKGETGFMVDIAKAIWEKNGYTVTYSTKTWKQALDDTRCGISTAIVGANREDAPDFLFPKVEQARAQGTFYAASSCPWKYSGPGSLSSHKLGIISDYRYNPEIAGYIRANRTNPQNIRAVESNPDILSQFFDMIEHNHIETFIEDRNVVEYFLKNYERPDKFTAVGALRHVTPLYVAVSPHALDGDALVKELSEGMEPLRQSGELTKILTKYGLAEIPAPSPEVIATTTSETDSPQSPAPSSPASGKKSAPASSDDVPEGYTAFGFPINK